MSDLPSHIKWSESSIYNPHHYDGAEDVEWAVCTYPHDYGFEYVVPIIEELAIEFVKSFVGDELFEKDSLKGLFWPSNKEQGFCNKYAFIVRRARWANETIGVYRHDWRYWMIRKEVTR